MLASLLRIITLTRKELLAVLKDPRSRIALIVPPILQTLIFGYAASYDLNRVLYAALNQDGGYQNHHRVYDRAGEVCTSCGHGAIVRIVQAQRSTFFCPRCQRRK